MICTNCKKEYVDNKNSGIFAVNNAIRKHYPHLTEDSYPMCSHNCSEEFRLNLIGEET